MLFYPLQFNPVSGELRLYTRIRVRVDYEAAAARMAAAAVAPGSGWPIPATAAYRVRTAEEGMHRISRDWLVAQGIGASEIDAIDIAGCSSFMWARSRRSRCMMPAATVGWMRGTGSAFTRSRCRRPMPSMKARTSTG